MRTAFLCIFVLRVASEPRVKLARCISALNPPVVCSTDRSKVVVPVLVLLFVALWFILRGDLLYVFPCVILLLCFFSPFSIAITSLGEERANLSAFRTFVWFVLVWICRFPLSLGVWDGLRFVIVALPGRFSYRFWTLTEYLVYVIKHFANCFCHSYNIHGKNSFVYKMRVFHLAIRNELLYSGFILGDVRPFHMQTFKCGIFRVIIDDFFQDTHIWSPG